jgi:hypothetical protein
VDHVRGDILEFDVSILAEPDVSVAPVEFVVIMGVIVPQDLVFLWVVILGSVESVQ